MPDEALAEKLHSRFYSQMPLEEFKSRVIAPRRGLALDIGSAIIGGGIDTIEIFSRAARTLDQPGGRDTLREAATKAIEFTTDLQEAHPKIFAPSKAAREGYFRRSIYGGVRSFLPSISAGLPGALAGGIVGGGLPGGIVGFAASGGTIFGLAEYDKFIEEAKDAGVDSDVAHSGAVRAAFLEGGLEGASNAISAAMLGLGKPLTQPLKNTLRGMLKTSARSYLAKVSKIAVAETTTEMLQEAGGAKLRQQAGIPTIGPFAAAKEAIGPSLVMSFLFATGGTTIDIKRKKAVQKALLEPKTPTATRTQAVTLIGKNLSKIDPSIAETWTRKAIASIKENQPISVDEDITVPQQILEKNIRKGLNEEVANLPKEVKQVMLGKSMPDTILEALGDTETAAVLEKGGITDEFAQVDAIVADKVKQKIDAAINLKRIGKHEVADKIKEEALENARTIIANGDDHVKGAVHEALGMSKKIPVEETKPTTEETLLKPAIRSEADLAASPEAISRIKTEKAKGIEKFKVDTRSNKEIPLIGVDAIDVQPGPYDVIVQREPDKPDTVLSRGAKAKDYIGKARKMLRDERGMLFPPEPDENFTSEGAKDVEAMYEASEKATGKKVNWPKLYRTLRKQIVDVRGNLQDAFSSMGELGQRVIVMQDLISGAPTKAMHTLEQFKERIYGDLTPKEHKYLDRFITSIRILTIEKYKPINQPRGLKLEHREWLAQLSPELKVKLADRAKKYFAATRWVLDNQLEEGLIDEATHKRMADKGPFETRKFLHHVDPAPYSKFEGGKRISIGESGNKSLGEGSEELLDTDSEMLLSELIARHTNRVFRNNASKSLLELAQETDADFVKIGTGKKKTPRGWKKIYAMVEGKRRTLLMKEDLANEWIVRDANINETTAKLLRWFTGTSLLKAMATGLNPAFAITNPFRDIALVWASDYNEAYSKVLPKYLMQMGQDLGAVASDAVRRRGRYQEAVNDGGMMEFLVLQGRLTSRRAGVFSKLQTYAGWLGETSEILVRLALRERHIRNGATSQEATWAARNYLDFSKGGSTIKMLDNAIPYLNASVQASRGMVRAAIKNPSTFALKMSQVILLSMGMFFANRYENDEAYKDVNPHDRINNWIITTGHYFYDKSGNKKYLYYKIAKDQGQRVFASIGENAARALIGEEVNIDEVVQASREFLSITASGILPPPVKAMLGYMSNYDFWRNQQIWRGPEIKAKREFTRYTSPALKNIGEVTGLSPERMRFALSQYFTSGNIWTSTVGHAYNRITGQMPENDRDLVTEEILSRKPGLRRLMSTTDPYFRFQKATKKAKLEASTGRFEQNQNFDEITQDVLRDEKPMKAITEYLKQQPFSDRKRLLRRFKRSRKLFRVQDRRWWLDLAEMPPAARAVVYFNRIQESDSEEKARLKKQLFQIPGVNSREFRRELFKTKKSLQFKR